MGQPNRTQQFEHEIIGAMIGALGPGEMQEYGQQSRVAATSATLINDPRSDGQIDVTGWELDRLADVLATLAADIAVGSERLLSDEESDVLDLDAGSTGIPAGRWDLRAPLVLDQVIWLREIVHEAIHQRDLPAAIAAKAQGQPLTLPQELAYRDYVGEIAEH